MDPVHTVHQYCPSAKSFKVYLYKFSSAQLGTNPITLYLVLVNTPSSPGVWEPHSLIQTDLSGALWPAALSAFYTPGNFCSWLQSCHKEESNKVNSEKNVHSQRIFSPPTNAVTCSFFLINKNKTNWIYKYVFWFKHVTTGKKVSLPPL